MPPMATPSSSKRKWSEVFTDGDDGELYDKQSLMDLCSSKLRYVNPARPPRRRTEVPLLRNVLIVNTMKQLSTDLRQEKAVDSYGHSEDLSVDPGHFEGLPPLSELLTDIMLDPQPSEPCYPGLTPLEPSLAPAYMDTNDLEEEKVVHDLLPCTSVHWGDTTDPLDTLASDLAFQPSSGTLPSFTSLFENSSSSLTPTSSYTDLTPVVSASQSTASVASSNLTSLSSTLPPNDELVGNTTLTEAELEVLAMAFSSKLPHVSFEELVHALPQSSRLQQQQQHNYQSQMSSYYVPSSISPSSTLCGGGPLSESASPPPPNNPCGATFYRKDQPQPSVEENMVRVLVNL